MYETELEAERTAQPENDEDVSPDRIEISWFWLMILVVSTAFAGSTSIVGATEAFFPIPWLI